MSAGTEEEGHDCDLNGVIEFKGVANEAAFRVSASIIWKAGPVLIQRSGEYLTHLRCLWDCSLRRRLASEACRVPGQVVESSLGSITWLLRESREN